MSKLISVTVDHDITANVHDFDPVQMNSEKVGSIQIEYTDIPADITASLLMSVDGNIPCLITESEQVLDDDKDSHLWNLFEVSQGAMFVVRISGSASPAGTIDKIKYLY
jgi:hypothetical protein